MAHLIAPVELLQSLHRDLQAEVSFKHHASLLQVVTAPPLQELPVKQAAAEVLADLVARVVVAVVHALVDEFAPFQELLHRQVDRGRLQSECLADFGERKAFVETQIKNLLHVQGPNLLIDSPPLLLLLALPLLRRRLLTIELAVECLHVVQQCSPLFVEQLLLLTRNHRLKLNGLILITIEEPLRRRSRPHCRSGRSSGPLPRGPSVQARQ